MKIKETKLKQLQAVVQQGDVDVVLVIFENIRHKKSTVNQSIFLIFFIS